MWHAYGVVPWCVCVSISHGSEGFHAVIYIDQERGPLKRGCSSFSSCRRLFRATCFWYVCLLCVGFERSMIRAVFLLLGNSPSSAVCLMLS